MTYFFEKIKGLVLERVKTIPEYYNLRPNQVDFCQIFSADVPYKIIAEIKFASPSLGNLYQGTANAIDIAKQYLASSAAALSVLTEPVYFKGNINYLSEIRQHFPHSFLLQKDFILSEAQINQALISGAHAILLIVAFLQPAQLRTLYDYTLQLGLTPLIEVHNEQELEIALSLKPKVIGINNRDLKTMKIDLNISRVLINKIPKNIFTLCESGIEHKNQVEEFKSLGFSGFLIGSSFMRHDRPGQALKRLLD